MKAHAGRSEGIPAGPTEEGMRLALAWGGARYSDAALLAPAAMLGELTERLQAYGDIMARRDFALGLLRRPGCEALRYLASFAIDDDPSVRWAVTQPSTVWEHPESAGLMHVLSTDGSAAVRLGLARTLRDTPSAAGLAVLARMGDDADVWVRLSMVALYGSLAERPQMHHALMQRLHDAHAWVRASAVQMLAHAGAGAQRLDTLARMAQDDPVAWVRRTALRELALAHPWRARLALAMRPACEQSALGRMILRLAPEWPLRFAAHLWHLGELLLRVPGSFDDWADELRNPHGSAAAKAVAQGALLNQARIVLQKAAAAKVAPVAQDGIQAALPVQPVSVEQVSSVLLDPLHPIRGLDALPTSRKTTDATFPVVAMAQQSVDPLVRSHVAWTLAELHEHPEAWPMFAAMLDDPSLLVRQQMANAVASLAQRDGAQDAQLLPMAKRLAGDADADVRVMAIKAVARIRDHETGSLLALAARDPSAYVRIEAVRAWRERDPHGPVFAALAEDRDPTVRDAVAYALAELPFSCMHLAPALLRGELDPIIRDRLMRALVAPLTPLQAVALDREASLRAMHGLRHDHPDVAAAEDGLRTRYLVEALLVRPDNQPSPMLLAWAQDMHRAPQADRSAGLAKLPWLHAHAGRFLLLATLLDSPDDDVRTTAGRIFGEFLDAQNA